MASLAFIYFTKSNFGWGSAPHPIDCLQCSHRPLKHTCNCYCMGPFNFPQKPVKVERKMAKRPS